MRECRKCKVNNIVLEEHHVWPKVLDNKSGKIIGGWPSRINLCERHHKEVKEQIIIPILKEYSKMPEYNSEFWLWKYIEEQDKQEVIKRIVNDTILWVGLK